MDFLPRNAADTKSLHMFKKASDKFCWRKKNPSRQAYLILKFWTTNSWNLGKYSGERELHNYPTLLMLQRTWHWPQRQGSRQAVQGVQPGTHSLILVCVQRALFVPSLGRAAYKRFVVPILNSSGINQEHTAINAPGSAVSCWHSRRVPGSSPCPRVQAPHVPPDPIASIPPRAIKLTYL